MNGERGFIMIWALLLVVLVGVTSSLLFVRSSTLLAESGTDHLQHRAFWAAEGGLAEARLALAADADYEGGTCQVGDCRAISTVTRTDGGWRVEVRATPGGARLEAELTAGDDALPQIREWRVR